MMIKKNYEWLMFFKTIKSLNLRIQEHWYLWIIYLRFVVKDDAIPPITNSPELINSSFKTFTQKISSDPYHIMLSKNRDSLMRNNSELLIHILSKNSFTASFFLMMYYTNHKQCIWMKVLILLMLVWFAYLTYCANLKVAQFCNTSSVVCSKNISLSSSHNHHIHTEEINTS